MSITCDISVFLPDFIANLLGIDYATIVDNKEFQKLFIKC